MSFAEDRPHVLVADRKVFRREHVEALKWHCLYLGVYLSKWGEFRDCKFLEIRGQVFRNSAGGSRHIFPHGALDDYNKPKATYEGILKDK
jgi:hypothetical protein